MAAPSDTTIYNTSVPSYLQKPVEELAASSKALADANMNYVPFQGQGVGGTQLAGLDPQTVQGMKAIQAMQPSQYTTDAAGLAGLAGTNQFTDANVQRYMSPYMHDVVNQQQLGAISDYGRSLPTLGAGAARMGALGGDRSALMQSEANRNLQGQLQNINATGLQAAFQNAQQQFNASNQNQLAAARELSNEGQQDYAQRMGIAQGNINAGVMGQKEMQDLYNIQYQNFRDSINQPFAMESWLSNQYHGTSPASLGTSYQKTDYTAPINNAMLAASTLSGIPSLMSNSSGTNSASSAA